MIPVFQHLTVANDGHGNCFNACVASILELPLRDVAQVHPESPDFWGLWQGWLAERGFHLTEHPIDRPPRGFSIVVGLSDRIYPAGHREAGERVGHACVAFDGVVVHDPFPIPGAFDDIWMRLSIDTRPAIAGDRYS